MKQLAFISGFLLFTLAAFAQPKADTAQTHRADMQARQFVHIVKAYTARINESENMDSIRLIAVSLRKQADSLISSVKRAYKINDDALAEADNYTSLANQYVNSNPSLATKYLGMAQQKRNQSGEPPDYFDALEHIQDITNRIATVKRKERAKKLELQLKDAAHEFSIEVNM